MIQGDDQNVFITVMQCRKAREKVILQLCGGLMVMAVKLNGAFKMSLFTLKSKILFL